jgi:hypothetical protein
MGASETAPPDAFEPCPRCGHDFIDHDVASEGYVIHPDGEKICYEAGEEIGVL